MEGVKALDIGKDRVGVADVYVVAVHRPARAAPCGVRCYARLVGLVIPNSCASIREITECSKPLEDRWARPSLPSPP